MEKFIVQFDNGIDRRSTVTERPDAVYAAMFGQRHAPDAFAQSWNRVADQRKLKIVIISENGERYEEPVVLKVPL